jgi:lipoate-protein ligase A
MHAKSVYKIPNGKLLKVSIKFNPKTNIINQIIITGDFFVYPEEAIEIIENELVNTQLNKEKLHEKINSTITENNIEFIGLNAKGLTDGIMMCLK